MSGLRFAAGRVGDQGTGKIGAREASNVDRVQLTNNSPVKETREGEISRQRRRGGEGTSRKEECCGWGREVRLTRTGNLTSHHAGNDSSPGQLYADGTARSLVCFR